MEANWQRLAHTRDGIEYRIRPIRADDAERERRFILSLSPESLYNRLMYAMREPSADFVRSMVEVDYHWSMAFVALIDDPDGGKIIGVARYSAAPGDKDCEFAVTVADAWHARGIGTTLMNVLFEYAKAKGFTSIYGTVLASNQRMIELCERLGLKASRARDDARVVVVRRELH